MTTIPDDLSYTADHEWLRLDGDIATVGITAYAADRLGDIVFVELPSPGTSMTTGKVMVELESTKSVGEVFSPADATVEAVNEAVADDPALVNSEPYGAGWLVAVRLDAPPSGLLTAAEYRDLLAGVGA